MYVKLIIVVGMFELIDIEIYVMSHYIPQMSYNTLQSPLLSQGGGDSPHFLSQGGGIVPILCPKWRGAPK